VDGLTALIITISGDLKNVSGTVVHMLNIQSPNIKVDFLKKNIQQYSTSRLEC